MEQIENFKIFKTNIHSRAKDLTGHVFGDYKVLYRTECPEGKNPEHAWWLCQCVKCKKYFIKSSSSLTTGINKCKCQYDLTNKRFGRWTVLYKTENKTTNGTPLWHCKCDCGNEKDVNADTLRKGESKSCGCLNNEKRAERCRKTRIDITNQRYGKLIALYSIYSGDKNKHTIWHCKCDCGNECDVDLGNLRSGKSQSCGCTNSQNEEKIIKLLNENNIKFKYQIEFPDLIGKKFDFYIESDKEKYIIEYDGQQHFFYTGRGWDDKEHFNRTHKNDLIKNLYCFNNNIPIIRIPYDNDYTIKNLKLNTSRFLLTKDNENIYYKSREK